MQLDMSYAYCMHRMVKQSFESKGSVKCVLMMLYAALVNGNELSTE
jgi:hypothetical protein